MQGKLIESIAGLQSAKRLDTCGRIHLYLARLRCVVTINYKKYLHWVRNYMKLVVQRRKMLVKYASMTNTSEHYK